MRISIKTVGLVATLAAVAGFVIVDAYGDRPGSRDAPPAATGAGATSPPASAPAYAAAPKQNALQLPERSGLMQRRSELFSSQSWQPPPKLTAIPPPPPPVAPPVPYTFAGR